MKGLYSRKKSRPMSRQTGGGFWKGLLNIRSLIFAGLFFLIATGIVFSVWLYKKSSCVFPVSEVTFTGNMHLSDAELRTMAGISKDQGLLRLSARAIAERLMKSPWINSVSVRKDFPDRIKIKISEISPFAILELKGKAFLIDDKGRMLEEMKDAVPFLPIIAADPFNNRDNFGEALSLAKALKDRKVAAERNRVEILAGKGPESISMVMDNVVVKMGEGDYERKLSRFFELEEEIKRRAIPVDYIDLRFANRVIVKPISEVVK